MITSMGVQDTSIGAYIDDVEPTLGERQAAVIKALEIKDCVTNNELATILSWPINTVTPRIFELRRLNLVSEHCRRKDKNTGRTAICWQLSTKVQPELL